MKLYYFHGVEEHVYEGDTEYWKLAVCADDDEAAFECAKWEKSLGCDHYRGDYGEVDEVDGYRIIVGEKVSE